MPMNNVDSRKNKNRSAPNLSRTGKAEAEDRIRRRAEALRENLKKRKAQVAARASEPESGNGKP